MGPMPFQHTSTHCMDELVIMRAFRVQAELWEAAKAKAKRQGVDLSHVLRRKLREYVNEGD